MPKEKCTFVKGEKVLRRRGSVNWGRDMEECGQRSSVQLQTHRLCNAHEHMSEEWEGYVSSTHSEIKMEMHWL